MVGREWRAVPAVPSRAPSGTGVGSLTFHRALLLRLRLQRDTGTDGRGKALPAAPGHPRWTCPHRKRTHMLSPAHHPLCFQPHCRDNNLLTQTPAGQSQMKGPSCIRVEERGDRTQGSLFALLNSPGVFLPKVPAAVCRNTGSSPHSHLYPLTPSLPELGSAHLRLFHPLWLRQNPLEAL